MNPDRVYLVIALVIAVVVLANAVMFAMVRGSRGVKMDWLHSTKDTLHQPSSGKTTRWTSSANGWMNCRSRSPGRMTTTPPARAMFGQNLRSSGFSPLFDG